MLKLILLSLLISPLSFANKPVAKKTVAAPAKGKAAPAPTATASPTPTEEPEEPVMGTDEDNDGLRDDVQAWAIKDVPGKNEKEAVKQIFKYWQEGFKVFNELKELKKNAKKDVKAKKEKAFIDNRNNVLKSFGCLHMIINDVDKTQEYSKMAQIQFFNTNGRAKLKEEMDKKLEEMKAPMPVPKDPKVESPCEFKLIEEKKKS